MAKIVNIGSDLERELEWLEQQLAICFLRSFSSESVATPVDVPGAPELGKGSIYGRFVAQHKLNCTERTALILALVPHIRPQLLDVLFTVNEKYDRGFTEFGGLKGKRTGVLPTGETLAFIVCGNDIQNAGIY